ncbi:hypothetical protein JCM3765_000881 [Sporobolomyces pararoseus]
MVGLFAPPSAPDDQRQEALKQTLFLKLKAITVPLLDASRSPVSSSSTKTVLGYLRQLESTLDETPSRAFNPSLANYAFFPLTSLLQPRPDGISRGDRVLESTMRTLNTLIKRWRQVGMEERVRKELWTMTILTLGGPLNSRDEGRGKEVHRTEESQLAMVQVLDTLMKHREGLEPEEEEEDSFGDLSARQNNEESTFETPPSLSILFHTLTTLLSLAVDPTSLIVLQLSSISALRTLTIHYLAPNSSSQTPGPSSLLATALPGMASTLSRIALSKPPSSKTSLEIPSRKQTASVIVAALDLLTLLVELSVSDRVTVKLREEDGNKPNTLVSLEELGAELPGSPSLEDPPPLHQPATDSSPQSQGTVPTPAWLRFTVSSLSSLFTALSPLTSHHSPTVRSAFVDLLSHVARQCPLTFGPKLEGPLEGLLILSGDEWEVVFDPARKTLLDILDAEVSISLISSPLILLGQIVHRRLVSLPLVFRKREEDSIRRSAGVIRTALDILPVDKALEDLVSTISKWSWNLLGSFEMERITTARGGEAGEGGMALAWINEGSTTTRGEDSTSFPQLRLRNLHDNSTLLSLDHLWVSFGAGAARAQKEDILIDHFVGVALGPRREESVATNALWILDGLLKGMSKSPIDKRRKKVVKGLVRAVIGLMEDLDIPEEEVEEEPVLNSQPPSDPQSSTLDSLAPSTEVDTVPMIQHNKGVTPLPSLSEYNPVASRATSSLDRASHRILLLSLSLRILATSSSLLQTSFRPLLLPSLYHVLACSSSTGHPVLRSHAQTTLSLIAESTSFASSQNLVLANVDYVVNSVSQRMSVTRLDPSAPLVLVEMIRLVGKPIVAIVQDLVDDVFEALDDYHGYEEVTVGLWAVLDSLLKVMEEDIPPRSEVESVTVKTEEFKCFKTWFSRRKDPLDEIDAPKKEEEGQKINPQKPFESGFASSKEDPSGPTEFPESESKQDPPTRHQVVTAQILSKSLYFLSHPSPFLRARVLSLIASAVPLLARPSLETQDRSADLLPVIHRAWPFILNRLADAEIPVVVEAATLVEALASHVGDFMSRRILDDVWPRFRQLLTKQELDDSTSALYGSTRFSNSHRLYRSILRTLLDVARHVPLKEDVLWDQAFLLRRFLSPSVNQELQDYALKLYRSFEKVNRDVVWLVLAGSVRTESGLPEFLAMENSGLCESVMRLVDRI